MAEDFVGVSGSLNESFVGATNDKLFEVPFEALEVRMAKEKPQVMPGLTVLKKAMSAPAMWANEQFDPQHPDTFGEKVEAKHE